MADELLVSDRGAVRILTLNRPEKRNALNFALTRALVEALRMADAAPGVACIVLAGAGPAFCAGADLGEFKDLTHDNRSLVMERAALTATLHGLFPRVACPVVGAIHGPAMGGGAGLALACDVAVAGESARFGYPEVAHGIVPAIVMANLVRVVGRKQAFELVATGRVIGAAEARALGMVNAVVPDRETLEAALAMANALASASRPALAMTKALFYRAADLPFEAALEEGRSANERMRALEPR
jgi:enoyl-CoA hydratase/carnithine racemase